MKSLWTLLSLSLLLPSVAHAWDPFRVENSHIARGNEQLHAHDADGALHEYEAAARELPAEPGVHLDRGLALLAKGVFDRAREALLVATEPPAPTAIRADAYYDMGIAFYRQGDAAATQAAQNATQGGAAPLQGGPGQGGQTPEPPHADHHEATRLFREAADSLRRSLRARPGNRDAAWNLELALRRIHDEEEAQRREDEERRQQQEQQQQQGDQGQQGQQGQQGDQQGQQQQQQQGDSQNGQQGQQQQGQNDQGQQGQQQGQQGRDPSQDPNGGQGQQQQEQQARSVGGNDSAAETDAQQSQHTSADGLPANVARVLDALPDSTVERARARAQAMRENRQPQQDW